MARLTREAPYVSVIIVNFNAKEFLEEALLSLRSQTFRDFEIIVVDNGSVDGSPQLVSSTFPQVRLISLAENTGFARGNNLGIQVARGELIALLNNDAVPDRHWLEQLIGAAERHPAAGFFASRVVLYSQPQLLDSAGDGLSAAGTVFRRGHLRKTAEYATEEYVFGAQGCAACYRRTMLQDIGLFDEDFFCVYEDADLSFRAQWAGYKCVYVPSAIVRHRGGSTIGRFSPMYVYQSHRNVEYLFFKDMPISLLVLTLPTHVLYNLLAFVFFTRRGQGLVFLRSKRDALRAFPRLWMKRRQLQKGRRVPLSYIRSQFAHDWVSRIIYEKLGRV
jgi:hypothetical protein